MKYLFLLIILISCSQKKEKIKDKENTTSILLKDTVSNKIVYNVDLENNDYNLSMNMEKYLLKVIPDSNSSKQDMNYKILMTSKSDIIIDYIINIDSINKNYIDPENSLKKDKIDFKKQYYLSGIDMSWWRPRADNLSFRAKLNSKKDTTKRHVELTFKTSGHKMGKLSIANISN